MRHANAASSSGAEGFICCLLGKEQYALHARDVRIGARAEQMQLDSTTADGRVGTLQHAGRALPVYSLAARFGRRADRSGLDRHVIVTRGRGGEPYGLLVDRMLRAPSEHPGRLLPLPAAVGSPATEWFDGLLTFGDDLACLVLSPAALDPRGGPSARARDPRPGSLPRPTIARQTPAEIVATFTSDALPEVGVRRFALGAHRVAAVTQTLQTVSIPGAAPWVADLGRWRDHAVPILSFNGEHTALNGSRRCLVVRTGGRFSGGFVTFAVNADIELHRATSAAPDPAHRHGINADFVIGIYMVDGEPAALLDIDRLAAGVSVPAARPVARPAVPEPLPLVV